MIRNIDFNLGSKDKVENIFNKIRYTCNNNLEKRLSEKELDVIKLNKITGIEKKKINALLENDFKAISIKDLMIISFILGVNIKDILEIKFFGEDKQTKEYSKGFIDGIYYAIQIIKNLDSDINLDRLLDIYNKLN